jgi:hypothetical protein
MELTTAPNLPLPLSILSLLAVTTAFLAVFAHRFFAFDYDPREPPMIKPKIPYFGHILGIIRYGTKYFEMVK